MSYFRRVMLITNRDRQNPNLPLNSPLPLSFGTPCFITCASSLSLSLPVHTDYQPLYLKQTMLSLCCVNASGQSMRLNLTSLGVASRSPIGVPIHRRYCACPTRGWKRPGAPYAIESSYTSVDWDHPRPSNHFDGTEGIDNRGIASTASPIETHRAPLSQY